MILTARGRVFATPSAITVLIDGNERYSGQVGAGEPLDTEITFLTYDWVDPPLLGTASVSISVTSGVVTIGPWFQDDSTTEEVFGEDARISDTILINGLPPEWPATPVDPMPEGTPENPDWYGWFFELAAGETITFNIQAPGLMEPAPTPPGP